jgi:hypothetical protein
VYGETSKPANHPAGAAFDFAHDSGHKEFLNVLTQVLKTNATDGNTPSGRVPSFGDIHVASLLVENRTLRNTKCPA